MLTNAKLLMLLILLTSSTLPEVVEQAAISQGLDPIVAARIVTLESDWDIQALGAHGEVGLWQFKPETWRWLSAKYGVDGKRTDPVLTSLVACRAIADGYGEHWSTYGLAQEWRAHVRTA